MAKSKLEYLQKYLGGQTEEKKQRKKIIKKGQGMRIVDEDFDLKKLKHAESDDEDDGTAYATKEEQPQVAGFVDERPKDAILKETFSDSSRWKTLGASPKRQSGLGSEVERSANRHDSDSDHSPCRAETSRSKRRHDSDSDNSPARKQSDSDSDVSPPRRKSRQDSESEVSRTKVGGSNVSPLRNDTDSDQSPVRVKNEPGSDSDQSPVRTKKRDLSPARRMIERNLSRKPLEAPAILNQKLDKTLDGKKAGLQSKTTLMEENAELKRREAEFFERAGSEITGRGAKVVARAAKQRIIDEKEKQKKEKEEKMKELQTKYNFWSKGVKQQEQFSSRINEMAHEMSKPLTRHAGDEDLERHLKEQVYEEDPMAAYVTKKKTKGKPDRPKYHGPAPPPNRYGIPPGYRWDGVDRSSGFEKEWFESQNSKKALEEEAYKWRSEDM